MFLVSSNWAVIITERTSVCGRASLSGAFNFSFQLLSEGPSLLCELARGLVEMLAVANPIFVLFNWSASAEAIVCVE